MSDTPVPPKSGNTTNLSPAKLQRQARLNAALRANLRRRKGPESVSDNSPEPEEVPQIEAKDGDQKAE